MAYYDGARDYGKIQTIWSLIGQSRGEEVLSPLEKLSAPILDKILDLLMASYYADWGFILDSHSCGVPASAPDWCQDRRLHFPRAICEASYTLKQHIMNEPSGKWWSLVVVYVDAHPTMAVSYTLQLGLYSKRTPVDLVITRRLRLAQEHLITVTDISQSYVEIASDCVRQVGQGRIKTLHIDAFRNETLYKNFFFMTDDPWATAKLTSLTLVSSEKKKADRIPVGLGGIGTSDYGPGGGLDLNSFKSMMESRSLMNIPRARCLRDLGVNLANYFQMCDYAEQSSNLDQLVSLTIYGQALDLGRAGRSLASITKEFKRLSKLRRLILHKMDIWSSRETTAIANDRPTLNVTELEISFTDATSLARLFFFGFKCPNLASLMISNYEDSERDGVASNDLPMAEDMALANESMSTLVLKSCRVPTIAFFDMLGGLGDYREKAASANPELGLPTFGCPNVTTLIVEHCSTFFTLTALKRMVEARGAGAGIDEDVYEKEDWKERVNKAGAPAIQTLRIIQSGALEEDEEEEEEEEEEEGAEETKEKNLETEFVKWFASRVPVFEWGGLYHYY